MQFPEVVSHVVAFTVTLSFTYFKGFCNLFVFSKKRLIILYGVRFSPLKIFLMNRSPHDIWIFCICLARSRIFYTFYTTRFQNFNIRGNIFQMCNINETRRLLFENRGIENIGECYPFCLYINFQNLWYFGTMYCEYGIVKH